MQSRQQSDTARAPSGLTQQDTGVISEFLSRLSSCRPSSVGLGCRRAVRQCQSQSITVSQVQCANSSTISLSKASLLFSFSSSTQFLHSCPHFCFSSSSHRDAFTRRAQTAVCAQVGRRAPRWHYRGRGRQVSHPGSVLPGEAGFGITYIYRHLNRTYVRQCPQVFSLQSLVVSEKEIETRQTLSVGV